MSSHAVSALRPFSKVPLTEVAIAAPPGHIGPASERTEMKNGLDAEQALPAVPACDQRVLRRLSLATGPTPDGADPVAWESS